jgi:hypothetical protein
MSWNKPYGSTGKPVNKHVHNLCKNIDEIRQTQDTKTTKTRRIIP